LHIFEKSSSCGFTQPPNSPPRTSTKPGAHTLKAATGKETVDVPFQVTDKSYRTGGFDIPTLGLPGGNDGIGFNSYGDPRTYGMGVRYRWGDK